MTAPSNYPCDLTTKFHKSDLARIMFYAIFTPTDQLPLSKKTYHPDGADDRESAEVDVFTDNELGWSQWRVNIASIFFMFGLQKSGEIAVKIDQGGIERSNMEMFLAFAFDDYDALPELQDLDFREKYSNQGMKVIGELICRLFGGTLVDVSGDYISMRPDDRLPDLMWNVWTPFMDTYWPEMAVSANIPYKYYYNHPKLIMNRILARNSIDEVKTANGVKYIPAGFKERAARAGMPYPQYYTPTGVVSAGQIANHNPRAWEMLVTEMNQEGFEEELSIGKDKHYHAFYESGDQRSTKGSPMVQEIAQMIIQNGTVKPLH